MLTCFFEKLRANFSFYRRRNKTIVAVGHSFFDNVSTFTAVFQAYKDETAYITSSNSYQTELGEIWHEVENDNELGARVVNGVRKADDRAFKEIDCILRSNDEEKEQFNNKIQ